MLNISNCWNTSLLFKTSDLQDVDEARKELFCQKGKPMERLPPTQDALLQHSKRVAYHAGIWCTSEHSEQHAPTPEGWVYIVVTKNIFILFLKPENVCLDTKIVILSDLEAEISVSVIFYS